jgi:hypothetical protein
VLGIPTATQGNGMRMLNKQQAIRHFVALAFLYDFALQLQAREVFTPPQVPNEADLHLLGGVGTGVYRRGKFSSRTEHRRCTLTGRPESPQTIRNSKPVK